MFFLLPCPVYHTALESDWFPGCVSWLEDVLPSMDREPPLPASGRNSPCICKNPDIAKSTPTSQNYFWNKSILSIFCGHLSFPKSSKTYWLPPSPKLWQQRFWKHTSRISAAYARQCGSHRAPSGESILITFPGPIILKQSCRHTSNENLVNHLLLTHRNVDCRISISFLTMWIIYRQVW